MIDATLNGFPVKVSMLPTLQVRQQERKDGTFCVVAQEWLPILTSNVVKEMTWDPSILAIDNHKWRLAGVLMSGDILSFTGSQIQ